MKEYKLKNLGFTGGTGGDYFQRMSALSEEVAKMRQELRSAEEARDAYRRELQGEEPLMLPDIGASPMTGAPASEYDARIDAQRKQLDELLRRFTDQHPDVVATRRLLAQLEEQKKQETEARRKATAAQGTPRFSASTNPVFQRIKISLAEAEASVAALRSRVSEAEGRLAQLRAIAGKAPGIEADLAQLNRDYDVLRKNYEELVARRESASIAGDVDTAGLAEFRIIDPPRIAPNPVFPNRLALIFLVLLVSIGTGLTASFVMAQAFPTFHAVAALRQFTQRPVLGSVSVLENTRMAWRRRLSNTAFAGGFAMLIVTCGVWAAWVATNVRTQGA